MLRNSHFYVATFAKENLIVPRGAALHRSSYVVIQLDLKVEVAKFFFNWRNSSIEHVCPSPRRLISLISLIVSKGCCRAGGAARARARLTRPLRRSVGAGRGQTQSPGRHGGGGKGGSQEGSNPIDKLHITNPFVACVGARLWFPDRVRPRLNG